MYQIPKLNTGKVKKTHNLNTFRYQKEFWSLVFYLFLWLTAEFITCPNVQNLLRAFFSSFSISDPMGRSTASPLMTSHYHLTKYPFWHPGSLGFWRWGWPAWCYVVVHMYIFSKPIFLSWQKLKWQNFAIWLSIFGFFASNVKEGLVKGSSNSNFVHTAYGKTFCHSHTVKFSQKILPE